MCFDFKDSAYRHYKDAIFLHKNKRLPTSDHLFGIASECALKAVLQGLGMGLDTSGRPEKQYRVHINRLWEQFISFPEQTKGTQYINNLLECSQTNPFHDWNIDQRYHHRKSFSVQRMRRHRIAAREIIKFLNQARLDGVVP